MTTQCTLPETNSSLAGKSTILMVFTRKDGDFQGRTVSFREVFLAQAIIYLKKIEMNCSSNGSQQKNLFQKAVCGKRYSRILPAYSAKTTMEAMEKSTLFQKEITSTPTGEFSSWLCGKIGRGTCWWFRNFASITSFSYLQNHRESSIFF